MPCSRLVSWKLTKYGVPGIKSGWSFLPPDLPQRKHGGKDYPVHSTKNNNIKERPVIVGYHNNLIPYSLYQIVIAFGAVVLNFALICVFFVSIQK